MFKFLKSSSEADFTKIHDDTLPINDFTVKEQPLNNSSSPASSPIIKYQISTDKTKNPTKAGKKIAATILLFQAALFVFVILKAFSNFPSLEDLFSSEYEGDASLVLSLMNEEESSQVENISFKEREKCYLADSEVCYFDSYRLELKNGYGSEAFAHTTDSGTEVFSALGFTNTFTVIVKYFGALEIDDYACTTLGPDFLTYEAYKNSPKQITLFVDNDMKEVIDKAYLESFLALKTEISEYLETTSSDVDEIDLVIGFRDGLFVELSTDDGITASVGYLKRGKTSYSYTDSKDPNLTEARNKALPRAEARNFHENIKVPARYMQISENLTDEIIQSVITSTYNIRDQQL